MQQGTIDDINKLGSRLSLEIHCGVRYPGFDKNIFVCNCGVVFPIYVLKGSDDWSWAREKHRKEGNTQAV